MFKCDKCGECCRHLDESELYQEIDRGDGVCKFLTDNLCSIYDKRLLLCRVDESYELFFKSKMTKDEYDRLNTEGCRMIKKMKGRV